MCGIGGIYRMGKRPIRKWQLQHLACELEHRGTDATGFATMDDTGQVFIWKQPAPAWKACTELGFHKWCEKAVTDNTRILLVHTRAYTKGVPSHNENNHPLCSSPVESVVVHNGMVRNDDEIFDANKKLAAFKRSCQTDSDVFRAILDNRGGIDTEVIRQMKIVNGTAAVAAFHRGTPGKLLLLRDSNPLVLGSTADTLAFASTKEAVHKILRPWVKVHNIPMLVHAPDLSFTAMRDQTGWIIGPKGLEEHEVFKCNGSGAGGYVKYTRNLDYYTRLLRAKNMEKFEKRVEEILPAPNPTTNGATTRTLLEEAGAIGKSISQLPELYDFVVCNNGGCNAYVELSEDDRKLQNLRDLACRACGTSLTGAVEAGFLN